MVEDTPTKVLVDPMFSEKELSKNPKSVSINKVYKRNSVIDVLNLPDLEG